MLATIVRRRKGYAGSIAAAKVEALLSLEKDHGVLSGERECTEAPRMRITTIGRGCGMAWQRRSVVVFRGYVLAGEVRHQRGGHKADGAADGDIDGDGKARVIGGEQRCGDQRRWPAGDD